MVAMDELEKIRNEIAKLQKKAEEIEIANRQPVLEEVKSKIKLYGFTAKELGISTKAKSTDGKKASTVAIKYRDGDNTWTGRGRPPKWMEEKIAAGAKKEDFLI
jgi:DNA-binding protein H-NS